MCSSMGWRSEIRSIVESAIIVSLDPTKSKIPHVSNPSHLLLPLVSLQQLAKVESKMFTAILVSLMLSRNVPVTNTDGMVTVNGRPGCTVQALDNDPTRPVILCQGKVAQ